MTKISKLFHKVGNWHNKISVVAGLTKADLKKRFKDTSIPEEMEKVLARLSILENHAVQASKVLDQLKASVHDAIDSNNKKRAKPKRRVK